MLRRGLEDPQALVDLFAGRPVAVKPAFDCFAVPLRRPADDPQLRHSDDGIPMHDSSVPVTPRQAVAFPLAVWMLTVASPIQRWTMFRVT